MLPALFVAHGSPMIAVQENVYTQAIRAVGDQFRPKAVVLFSAHWESDIQQVSGVERYRTIHDFGGFPDALYQIQYPAVGHAEVTAAIGRLFAENNIPCQVDNRRGLDHGAWVVARMLYPNADVPVVAMSVNANLPPHEQYRTGQALAGLRAEDVLIVGSGATVHNFGTIRWGAPEGVPDTWAQQFDDWVIDRARDWDLKSLFAYESLAPHARLAVPAHGQEHFVPLFYAMGAADDQRTARELCRYYEMGNLSYALWQFGG